MKHNFPPFSDSALWKLSRKQRERTPRALALYLVARAKQYFNTDELAVLFCHKDTEYAGLPGVHLWYRERNALLYPGPFPIIAHPPCAAFGRFKKRSTQPALPSILCVHLAELYGGVIEQPATSCLFRLCAPPGFIETIRQSAFGYPTEKLTHLFWVSRPAPPLAPQGR